MVLSMTGFGRSLLQDGNTTVAVEVRTVNHRFLDLHVHLNRAFGFLESKVQQIVRNTIGRGRVDVNVSIRSDEPWPAEHYKSKFPYTAGSCT